MTPETKKIVCIEDDTFLLDLIKDKFADAGIVAIPAHTGSEGVLLAAQEHPDLILLDLMLPDTPGLDILDQLKADDAIKEIPVVIFSNLGEKAEVEKGLAHGAHTYLIKSNTLPGELVEVVSSILRV